MDDDRGLYISPENCDLQSRPTQKLSGDFGGYSRTLPHISVVVGAGYDTAELKNCLTALLAQKFQGSRYEVIVVDARSADARPVTSLFGGTHHNLGLSTRTVVQEAAECAAGAPAVQYLSADYPSSSQGNRDAIARNRGWEFARGSVIAFLDASLMPVPDWLLHGFSAMSDDVWVVRGSVTVPTNVPPREDERAASELAASGHYGSNCFVRKAALVAIGGYDERFPADWRIDLDLQFSLIEHSRGEFQIGRSALAEVTRSAISHIWGSSLFALRNLQFDALLARKHPTLYRPGLCRLTRNIWWGAHLQVVVLLGSVAVAALAAQFAIASVALGLWSLLTLLLVSARLRGCRHDILYVFEMLLTSLVVPPLAVFWCCVGAVRHRRPRSWPSGHG
ncbi:glycosyltransferase family 2 protein [uncultured Nevskia sp.]|uniref:glycosyltransferase n=1 Tax=uncultured Nevskia sp. TaxID=228950 RepID=UPI0025FE4716|nr:glycosyltransferase family A protein [uncultured Nevskia sp.]